MDGRVALATGQQPAVDREGDHARHHQRDGEAAPEEHVAHAGLQRPGITSMIALSTISIVAIDRVSEASAIGPPGEGQAGAQQREAG